MAGVLFLALACGPLGPVVSGETRGTSGGAGPSSGEAPAGGSALPSSVAAQAPSPAEAPSPTGLPTSPTPSGPPIVDRLVPFGPEREAATLDYLRLHVDPAATSIALNPRAIVLHWTGSGSLDGAWNTFAPALAKDARPELAAQGAVNVGTHFLVDRDGTIYRLIPETVVARHCIGLNQSAIGVENVGDGDKAPLTPAQVAANVALVRDLVRRFPIGWLVGHLEAHRMEGTSLFVERDPTYRNRKPDPGAAFLAQVRAEVADLGLQGPPGEASPREAGGTGG